MFSSFLRLCLTIFVPYVTAQETFVSNSFRAEKVLHSPSELNETQLSKLAAMSSTVHMNQVLDEICIPRVVGTRGHEKVKNYLKNTMRDLGWSLESDTFNDTTPNKGILEFENIIARLNPNARRYLVLACHYDSLYKGENVKFVGATDSAVPCAQLLNLATVMKEPLKTAKTSNVSLMFIFFDGEEAFKKWTSTDSIYGARHLADKWAKKNESYGFDRNISALEKIDMLMLLDLLGGADPVFYNYFEATKRWYDKLVQAERAVVSLTEFGKYSRNSEHPLCFRSYPKYVNYGVQDDHIPFLDKGVPIVHLIPYGFPDYWHELTDNRDIVDMVTTEHLNKVLRIFVASYLSLKV